MPRKDNAPVSIRIRLKYPDLDTFIEKYAANISPGGMFIQSRAPQPAGTHLRFEVLLADGSRLLKGEGKVIWVREYDAADPTRVHGMGVKFLDLDDESRSVVNFVLAHKGGRRAKRKKSATQEVQALVGEAQTDEEEPVQEESSLPPEPASTEATAADDTSTPGAPPTDEHQPISLMDTLDSGGDGVAVSLASAEETLGQIMGEAGISEAHVAAVLAGALQTAGHGADLAGLENLLQHEPPPAVDPEQVMAILQDRLGAAPVTPPARWEPPPPAVTPPPEEPVHEQPHEAEEHAHEQPVHEQPHKADEHAHEEPVDEQPVHEQPHEAEEHAHEEPVHEQPVHEQPFEAEEHAHEEPIHEQPFEAEEHAHEEPVHEQPFEAAQPETPPAGEEIPPLPDAAGSYFEEEEEEPSFDPRLLQAAAHVSRASHEAQGETGFDLSEPPEEAAEHAFVEPRAEPPAPEAPSVPEPGWKDLKTQTQWLDHGSSDVLQDLAANAARHDAPDDPGDGYQDYFGAVGEDEIEEAVTMPRLDDGPEPSAPGADRLSNEMWREVVREAADVSDPGSIPAVEVDEEMIEEDLRIGEWGPRADSGRPGQADFEEEHTLVSATPEFNGRVDPATFDDRANGDLLPADNIFPPDPDLDNEVFDALAGMKEPHEPRAPHETSAAPLEPVASAEIPSLDDLAVVAQQTVALSSQEETAGDVDLGNIQVVADDLEGGPDPADPDIKPRRKSNLFRRLFKKKE